MLPPPRPARAPPLQASHADRASQTNHTKTKTAERPFLERPALSEVDAVGSRLPLTSGLDARPPLATRPLATDTPATLGLAGALCAGAKGVGPSLPPATGVPSVCSGRGLRDGVTGRGFGRGKRRRENGGAGERRWRRRAGGPGLCPRLRQDRGQRQPLRAAVVRTQAINDGCSGRVAGRVGGPRPVGNPGAGACSRGSLAEQEVPGRRRVH